MLVSNILVFDLIFFFSKACFPGGGGDKTLDTLVLIEINPFPKQQILDSSELTQFVDDVFKFDENSKKFSKRVENSVEKGEIARYEQFLLFPKCCLKTFTSDT